MIKTSVTLEELVGVLNQADQDYYENDNPKLTDVEYDKLVALYKSLTGEEWVSLGKPSQQLTRVPHSQPMLSLRKFTTMEEFSKWSALKEGNGHVVITPKIDGVSCALRYCAKTGNLVAALSRGDGSVGESVFHAIQNSVKAGLIPKTVSTDRYGKDEFIEIRGEIYISKQDFQHVGGANPRNSAAGLLRRQTVDPLQKYLKFVAYRVIGSTHFYKQDILWLESSGFDCPPYNTLLPEFILNYQTHKVDFYQFHPDTWHGHELPYEIDGTVVAFNAPTTREALGETNKYPNWACALKFKTEEVETTLRAVDWSANRTGVVIPTYVFDAVTLEGTVVTRATGHNYEQFSNLSAKLGDKVLVRKANQIIPQVLKVTQRLGVKSFIPEDCPTCKSALRVNLPHLWCVNPNCQEKLIGVLENAGKRDNLDITGLGESVATALVESKLVKTLPDLFKLSVGQLASMPAGKSTFGTTRANKLHKAIEQAKSKPWATVLHSVGCSDLGWPECEAIAQRYSLEDLGMMNPGLLKMQLMDIRGIGETTAINFVEWLRINPWVFDLMGVLNTEIAAVDPKNQPLLGYTFVLTGKFSKSRGDYEKSLRALGANVSSSVSKQTTYLVMNPGEEGSSKHKDATKLGIKIIDEQKLKELLES